VDALVIRPARLREVKRVLDYPTTPAANEDVQVLMSSVDELLQRINTAADSEVGRLRTQTRSALAAAKVAVAANASKVREGMGELTTEGGAYLETYVRERPLVALGLTALFALAIGLWVGRSAARWC